MIKLPKRRLHSINEKSPGEFMAESKSFQEEYGDDVAWVYRHFPLDQIHPKARSGAEAAECVASVGGEDAFWAFTDIVVMDAERLDDLEGVYSEIGVSSSAVSDCVDSGEFKDRVNEVYQGGMGAGITGTPGNIIVNAKGEAWLIPGALSFEQIKETIDEALQS